MFVVSIIQTGKMKKYLLILINTVLIIQVFGQSYEDKKGNTQLWGSVTINDLENLPNANWYSKNYNDYESHLSSKDAAMLNDLKVTVFLGTWCGDTKLLLPKFIKTWHQMGIDEKNITLIAVHSEEDKYKQGPDGETIGLNIHRVPTFVFEKDGKEIGRIVERSIYNLDADIMQIALGNPYEERYQGVVILDKIMREIPEDSLFIQENVQSIYESISREVSNYGELNTYGYVLKAQGDLKKAEFVFMLNKELFPFNPNVRSSYGKILVALEKWEEAKLEFEEVLRLKGADEIAVEKLHEIYRNMKDNSSSN
jgi:tetratricopeptide (TPR) repeat protein